jgi:hypothetical protein
MENDSVRTSGSSTLVDMWIDAKLRAISVSREAIEGFLHLTPDRAAAMSEDDRSEFVRTHLTLIVTAATTKLRSTDAGAETVAIEAGDLGGRVTQRSARPDGERRSGDRRKGDRRKVNLGAPPTGERRR